MQVQRTRGHCPADRVRPADRDRHQHDLVEGVGGGDELGHLGLRREQQPVPVRVLDHDVGDGPERRPRPVTDDHPGAQDVPTPRIQPSKRTRTLATVTAQVGARPLAKSQAAVPTARVTSAVARRAAGTA